MGKKEKTSGATEQRKGKVQRSRGSTLIPVILALAGIAVLLYPVVATQWNNARQLQIAYEYSKAEKYLDRQQLSESFKAAQAYNQHTPGAPILDPWLARVAKDNNPYQLYLRQLNIVPEMGRLVIPGIKVDLPIYHGSQPDTLERGIGHLYGSSLPVGGKGTHAVLTGHSGLSTATLLDNLTKVKKGDAIYIQVAGQELKYQVRWIQVVRPDQVKSLQRQEGKDLLTVLTCTPYGINSHRLLVTGVRVPMDKSKPFAGPGKLEWPWWMGAIIFVACLAALLLGWWLWKQRRRDQDEEENKERSGESPPIASGGIPVTDAEMTTHYPPRKARRTQ